MKDTRRLQKENENLVDFYPVVAYQANGRVGCANVRTAVWLIVVRGVGPAGLEPAARGL